MKVCYICKKRKRLTSFKSNRTKKSGYDSMCSACAKKYQADWYSKHKEQHIRNARKNAKKYIKILRNYIFEYLKTHPCSELLRNTSNLERVKKEIAKCVVRCANCHRIATAKKFGYWKYVRALGAGVAAAADS